MENSPHIRYKHPANRSVASRLPGILLGAALALPLAGFAQTAPASKAAGKAEPRSPAKPQNFDGLTCQSDIAAELIGRKMSNGKVTDTEARYKALKLQYRGGHGMPGEPFFLGFWVICGKDHVLLEAGKSPLVKAVAVAPAPAGEVEMTVGSCKTADAKKLDNVIFARPASKKQGPWNVSAAWTVREPQLEFAPVKEKALTCQE